ncbi:MAG TPA: SOS response-associated peptidase [Syntrophomonadaceae bacterium]|nr:SOS response-associated peptidase [Syntrophomonadaceae bacterium]
MCGRYTITVDAGSIAWRFGAERPEFEFEPFYNAAPTQQLPVIIETGSQRQLVLMRWGLIPHWSKDMSIGNKLINARVETIDQKPAFKNPFHRRRCLIPADGYYEWAKVNGYKQPLRIISTQQNIFSFAGIWDRWVSPEGLAIDSFSILTTTPVASIRHIHHRMPLILPFDQEDNWLTGPKEWNPQAVQHFLGSLAPFSSLRAYPVSTRVNSPHFNDPSLITPV